MRQPTKSEINQIRNEGFRPQAVACILHDKKILFLYKKEHELWQFPQGGIDNGEDLEMAFFREMTEELGGEFVKSFGKNWLYFGDNEIIFSAQEQNLRELRGDDGQEIAMRGKRYFFILVQAGSAQFAVSNSEFDDYRWLSLEDGVSLCAGIHQKGKKRIMLKALEQLRELGCL